MKNIFKYFCYLLIAIFTMNFVSCGQGFNVLLPKRNESGIPVITQFTLAGGTPTNSHYITFILEGTGGEAEITHWVVNESPEKPEPEDPAWTSTKPAIYRTSKGYTTKEIYAWAKDDEDNVSNLTALSSLTVEIQYTGTTSWIDEDSLGNDYPRAAAIDYDDNLYVVGHHDNGATDKRWHIRKLAPDGSLKWEKVLDLTGDDETAQCVAVDSNDNVYIAGWYTPGTNKDWYIIKYDRLGTEPGEWSRTWDHSSGDDGAQGIAIDSTDNIYITGYARVTGDFDWWIKKFDAQGNEDPTTGWGSGDGKQYGDPAQNDTSFAAAIDSNDDIYIAGRVPANNINWMIRKYKPDGTLDTTFNSPSGFIEHDFANLEDWAYDIAIDLNNDIYVTGFVTQTAVTDIRMCLKKFDIDGTEYGAPWPIIINPSPVNVAWGTGVDSSGNVYIGGRVRDGGDTNNEWAMYKFDSTGIEDLLFQDIVTSATGDDWCRAVVVDSEDNVYGIGVKENVDYDWYVKKYYNP